MAATHQAVQPSAYVGFDTITTQIEHRLLKKGFQFNILVAGYSGLGKSTLVNTLFSSHLVDSHGRKSVDEPISKTSEISVSSHQLVENNVRLNINVIDTPGFGDQINNDKCWEPIVRYIKEQYSLYLRKELTAQRERHIQDTRVHAVLYFIQPNNRGLRSVDVIALKKLSEISNVIPVIAKADTLTLEERETFRKTLQREFEFHEFTLYPFDSDDLLEEERELNNSIRSIIPFAVIGSETEITIDGQAFKGRRTRWGTINVEDINQSEFVYLRDFLTRTHLQDLIETTSYVHYENFRSKQLTTLKENANTSARASSHIPPVNAAQLQNGVSQNTIYKRP
jgi:septin 3/9/12